MSLLLVRHPQTQRNADREISGWEVCEYSELGHAQFDRIVEYFDGNDLPVYSSDLPRAFMLAKKISDRNKVDLVVDKKLRERNTEGTRPYDSSETDEDLGKRVGEFLDGGVEDSIIVSHGGTTRWIIRTLCGEAASEETRDASRDLIFQIDKLAGDKYALTKIQI
jgi:broad specificity phosphatase PhoE